LLAAELQSYPADPMDADEADTVAWHLADVTLAVVIAAVERRTDPSTAAPDVTPGTVNRRQEPTD